MCYSVSDGEVNVVIHIVILTVGQESRHFVRHGCGFWRPPSRTAVKSEFFHQFYFSGNPSKTKISKSALTCVNACNLYRYNTLLERRMWWVSAFDQQFKVFPTPQLALLPSLGGCSCCGQTDSETLIQCIFELVHIHPGLSMSRWNPADSLILATHTMMSQSHVSGLDMSGSNFSLSNQGTIQEGFAWSRRINGFP